jgi:hypothetical protein
VTAPGGDAPFLEPDPPHWVARAVWYALLVSALLGAVAAVTVRVPETVRGRFTLARTGGAEGQASALGEMRVPESAFARLDTGQTVRLRFDAFPYQRYGAPAATIRSLALESGLGTAEGRMHIVFELPDTMIGGRVRGALLPGMGGRAEIVVGHRSLGGFLFGSYIGD